MTTQIPPPEEGGVILTTAARRRYEDIRMAELARPKREYRPLRPEEFGLAPREVPGSEAYTPENSQIVAAIEDGEIIATFTLFFCAHLEPMWIRSDRRHSPTILRRITEAMKALLRELGIKEAYTVVLETTPVLARYAEWFGGKRVPGALYNWKEKD